jgi:hypothetical protein
MDDPEIHTPSTSKSKATEVPVISMLDRFLCDEARPWSVCRLRHDDEVNGHVNTLEAYKGIFKLTSEITPEEVYLQGMDLSDKEDPSLESHAAGRFFAELMS